MRRAISPTYRIGTVAPNLGRLIIDLATTPVVVSTGQGYAIAIKPDGTLWAWGHEGNGKLGNGIITPTQVKNSPVRIAF